MGIGYLKISTTAGNGALPVANASYIIKNKVGVILYTGLTDANGDSPTYALTAPDRMHSQSPAPGTLPYALYDVSIRQNGYISIDKINVQVYDQITTVVALNMEPYVDGQDDADQTFVTPPTDVSMPTTSAGQEGTNSHPNNNLGTVNGDPIEELTANPTNFTNDELPDAISETLASQFNTVVIPKYITVHLGTPNSKARNVRVPFTDYIKNVVSSEIYPTWPTNALLANIVAIVTFALNRIYTEWYRSRGYDFDITNSTAYDMSYVPNREIYANISALVDEYYTTYARREGFNNPYFTEFCNGTTATCNGLSQWGTVTLANQGLSVLDILRYYYPNDLILDNAPTGNVQSTYPGTPLRVGSSGNDVARVQTLLNRIRRNYPLIPAINPVDGIFGTQTESAVRVFQNTFNLSSDGIVGRGTWNKLVQIYTAVTGLADLNGEGEFIGITDTPPTTVLRQGSRGSTVIQLQFLLNYIAQFYPGVPSVTQDGIFGNGTANAVRSFQRLFGLSADGVVGQATWNKLYQVFNTLQGDGSSSGGAAVAWPGVYLRQGNTGNNVITLQNLLNNARRAYAQISYITVDGSFGPRTDNAVRTFQRAAGLTVDGIVGPTTWNALAALSA
ncbi:MAG: peptidoglycan-binding protein [Clostridia bacterium]|nr:peptidoglycan-binding protein [Clostridia bacterium]